MRAPSLGPVRDDREKVGPVRREAEGLRETQVVADLRRHAHAFDRPRHDVLASREFLVLAREGEGVELRVARDVAVGRDPERVVSRQRRRRPGGVARLGEARDEVEREPARDALEPALRGAARRLGDLRAVHREARREHLRQEGEVRAAVGRALEQLRGAGVVRLPVFPGEVHLQQRDAHGGIMDVRVGRAGMIADRSGEIAWPRKRARPSQTSSTRRRRASRSSPKRPSNDQLLDLYAFYKQATEGDVSGSRPGMLDLKGRAKYDAWAEPERALEGRRDEEIRRARRQARGRDRVNPASGRFMPATVA